MNIFSGTTTDVIYQIIYIFILMGFGVIFSRYIQASSKKETYLLCRESGVLTLTTLLMRIAFPCLIFTVMLERYSVDLISKNWMLPVLGFLMPLVGYIIGKIFLVFFNTNIDKQRAFLFNCSINNYFFFPLPIVMSTCGQEGVVLLALMTIGSETALWTLGTISITGARMDKHSLKHLLSPTLIVLFLSIIIAHFTRELHFWNYRLTKIAIESIKNTGACAIPLAMIIAGINIGRLKPKYVFNDKWIIFITLMRLIIIPFILLTVLKFFVYRNILQTTGYTVASIVSVMPVATAGALFVEHYGGDKEFIGASMLVTTLFMLITTPLLLIYAGI